VGSSSEIEEFFDHDCACFKNSEEPAACAGLQVSGLNPQNGNGYVVPGVSDQIYQFKISRLRQTLRQTYEFMRGMCGPPSAV
jgi:hypothetical protein